MRRANGVKLIQGQIGLGESKLRKGKDPTFQMALMASTLQAKRPSLFQNFLSHLKELIKLSEEF